MGGAALLLSVMLSACGGGGSSSTATSSTNPSTFYSHSVAFRNNSAVAWGYNGYGQLGEKDKSTTNSNVPVPVIGVAGLAGIAAGGTHTLAFKNMSGVWAWGNNGFGQLGDGTTTARTTPVQVKTNGTGNPLLTGVTAVAAGGNHSLALDNGAVWAWGNNANGQLGIPSVSTSNVAVQVPSPLTGSPFSDITAVAAGGNFSLALDTSGIVWAWGSNAQGQLGRSPTATLSSNTPLPVDGITGKVIAIAAGGSHGLALTDDGTVWAWGYNGFGQLGTSATTTPFRSTPLPLAGFTGLTTSSAGMFPIAAGLDHSLALKNDGTLWAWGYNGFGQLGDSSAINVNNPVSTPVEVPVQVNVNTVPLANVVSVAAIGHHTLAATGVNKVWAWGDNTFGQLGNAKDGKANISSVPVTVTGFVP